jgi:perosamine synthetase
MSTPVYSSYIRRKDMDSVLNCLVTDSIGPGETYKKFTEVLNESLGAEYSAAFRSPVSALACALDCLALEPDAGVIISAAAPAYYLYVLKKAGFRPLVADIDLNSGAILPEAVAELQQKGARAMIVSGNFGIMSDFPRLLEAGMPIIEDISYTMGAYVDTRKAGDSGAMVMLSLESGGLFTSGEGAILFAKGKREASVIRNTFDALPSELKLSDMNASLGLAQL